MVTSNEKALKIISLSLIVALSLIIAPMLIVQHVYGDNVVSDVTGIMQVSPGGTGTFQVKIVDSSAQSPVGGDPESGCNAADGTPVTVTPVLAGVTFTPASKEYNTCGVYNTFNFLVSGTMPTGDYLVTFTASDSRSVSPIGIYHVEPAAFTLRVLDNTPPTLLSVHIQSNNANPIYAKAGDTITLSFTSSEAIQTPLVSIAGNPATVSGGPTVWTASSTMTGTEPERPVAFSIAFSDLAGNAGTTVTGTTDSSSVTNDFTKPTITLTGANPLYLQDNGVSYSDPGSSASDATSGVAGSVVVDSSTVDTSTPQVYTVTYNVNDNAGNPADQVERTVDVVHDSLDRTDKYTPDDGAIVKVIDFLAYDDPDVDTISATIASLIPSGEIRDSESLLLSRTGEPGTFNSATVSLVLDLSNPDNPSPPLLAVAVDDDVFATYLGFDSAKTRISDSGNGFGGTPPRTTDTVRFVESDRYTLADSAAVKVNKTALRGAGSVDVKIRSDSDAAGFTITLTEDGVNTGKFSSTSSVTFSESGTDSAHQIILTHIGEKVYADYPAVSPTNTATATIVASDSIAFEAGTTVDTTRRDVCAVDADGDGICDSWETATGLVIPTTVSGFDYVLTCVPGRTYADDSTGATVCPSTSRKDVYLEIDYMIGHLPDSGALDDVRAALGSASIRGLPGGAINGIALHYFVDEQLGHQRLLPFTAGAGVTSFLTIKAAHFGTTTERIVPASLPSGIADAADYLNKLLTAKRQVFHWALFGHKQDGDPDSSGLGERPGNDIWVTLGAFSGQVGTRGQQAGTLMHELGHNFGLYHGGSDDVNCKGNYLSVMNYLFQFDTPDGGFVAARPLSYSSYKFSNIAETALREDINSITSQSGKNTIIGGWNTVTGAAFAPLPAVTNTRIDWNRDGLSLSSTTYSQNTRYFEDVGDCHSTDKITVGGYNDNANLAYNFRGLSAFDSGAIIINQIHTTTSTDGTGSAESLAFAVDAVSDATINEGDSVRGDGVALDPDDTDFEVVIDYGDGTTETLTPTLVSEEGAEFSYSGHVYADDNPTGTPSDTYTITVTVTGSRVDAGGITYTTTSTDTATITVNNVSPHNISFSGATINEGTEYAADGTFEDPGADTWTATVNYGDGSPIAPLTLTGKTFHLSHVYVDDNPTATPSDPYTVTVTVTDDDTGSGSNTAVVTVNDVAPTVNAGLDQTVSSGTTVSFSGSKTDPGSTDTFTTLWNFGDGATTTGTLTPTHKYITIGTYTVTLTVTDDDGKSGSDIMILTVNPVTAVIDVNPANSQNGLKLNDQGNTQVAMFSSTDVDATKVNTSTVRLKAVDGVSSTCTGGATVTRSDTSKDLNGDGKKDILLIFKTNQICHTLATHVVELTGSLAAPDSRQFRGTDNVIVSP